MKPRSLILLLCTTLLWCAAGAPATEMTSNDRALARQYFTDLKKISDADGGKLWGVTLYGPTMIVDPQSGTIIANQPDKNRLLVSDDGVYIGKLGPEFNTANTSMEWSGVVWTMVRWDALSGADPYDRARLLVHESWHRVQKEVGIPSAVTANAHLDGVDGRVALVLEFRALSKALSGDKDKQKEAIADALVLRRYRQSRFPDNNENGFERHEGMAEYTGLKLCGLADTLLGRIAARKLQMGEQNDGLANSFPYLTGPAIGLMLDRRDSDWRTKVRHGADLPSLLATAIGWKAPQGDKQLQAAATLAGARYDADKLLAEEKGKAALVEQTVKSFRDKLHAQGRLIIPNNNLQFAFNPQEKLLPFDSTGVIYKTMRLSGDFGVLEVSNGIVRTNDWQYFIVAAPDKADSSPITGDGYTLKLNPGWQVAAKGNGLFVIAKK